VSALGRALTKLRHQALRWTLCAQKECWVGVHLFVVAGFEKRHEHAHVQQGSAWTNKAGNTACTACTQERLCMKPKA